MEAMTKDEKEEGIATAAMDSEKCFDSVCWEVTFQMLDRLGLDQRIWKPMLNFIASQKIQQGCGYAGAHVDLHEQHRTGVLFESAGKQRRYRRSGQESWKKKCLHFSQHGVSVRQEKKRRNNCNQPSRSRETLTDQPARHRSCRRRRKCSKSRRVG